MNGRNIKPNLKVEKTQAFERRNMYRRIKQFFVLALICLPIFLFLADVLTGAGVSDVWSVVIFVAIFIALWFAMLGLDKLYLKRAKKIRQIKNAQAVVDKYNAEVLKKREELAAANAPKDELEVEQEQEVETTQIVETEPENKNEQANQIDLPKTNKNVIINNEEKKNKLKQKKYGSFNNKRKK